MILKTGNSLVVLIAILCNQYHIYAQNLVPNPSFEILATPSPEMHETHILRAIPWFTPTTGTPDIFSPSNSNPWRTPSNLRGVKEAIEGENYIGIGLFLGNSSGHYFEYISVKLDQKLIANKNYCVSFYITCSSLYCRWTLRNLGFHLSKENPTTLPRTNGSFLNIEPTWFQNDYFNSNMEWQYINESIIVDDEYEYLTIGFFNDYPVVDTIHTSNFF